MGWSAYDIVICPFFVLLELLTLDSRWEHHDGVVLALQNFTAKLPAETNLKLSFAFAFILMQIAGKCSSPPKYIGMDIGNLPTSAMCTEEEVRRQEEEERRRKQEEWIRKQEEIQTERRGIKEGNSYSNDNNDNNNNFSVHH